MEKMPQRNVKRNKHAEPMSSGKYHKLDNYKFAMGLGANWIDQDTGIMYHIQEYQEAWKNPNIPVDSKPHSIRITDIKTGKELGMVDEYLVAEKMKDPEPDPRY